MNPVAEENSKRLHEGNQAMICLAIRGIEEFETRQLSVGLRQASIVASLDPCWADPPAECDAVAFLGHEVIDESLIENCLSKGRHVLIAASSGLSREAVVRLSATAVISNAQFSVVNPDRYLPSRQLIHQQLSAGQLGGVGLIRSHRWEPQGSVPDNEPSLPGLLIQDLDLAVWLFGACPEIVYAVENTTARPATQEQAGNTRSQQDSRSFHVHLGFQGGGMALADYSNRLPSGAGYQMLSVIGSAGVAHADDHRNMQLHFSGGQPRGVAGSERARGLTDLLQAFVDNLIAGKDMASSVTEWQSMLQLAEAVRRSLDSHNSVSLKDP